MENEFIPYEQALALKELGFDEPCFGFYTYKGEIRRYTNFDGELNEFQSLKNSDITMGNEWCTAPTFSQAFRWFREKYNIHAELYTADMGAIEYCFQIRDLYSEKYIYDNFKGAGSSYMGTFNTYEEAELACLKKLIEIIKTK